MVEEYRIRIREFFIRRLALKIFECVPCNAGDRRAFDWSVAERFVDTPVYFRQFVEEIVRTIGREIATQAQFDSTHSMAVDAAFFELSRDRDIWFNNTVYWEYTNEWRKNRYGNAPYGNGGVST